MSEDSERKILNAIREEESIHYSDVAFLLGRSESYARSFCRRLANKYPQYLKYWVGRLRRLSEIPPLDKLLNALDEVQKDRNKKAKLIKKALKNHIPHLLESTNGNARKEAEKLEKLFKKELGREG